MGLPLGTILKAETKLSHSQTGWLEGVLEQGDKKPISDNSPQGPFLACREQSPGSLWLQIMLDVLKGFGLKEIKT